MKNKRFIMFFGIAVFTIVIIFGFLNKKYTPENFYLDHQDNLNFIVNEIENNNLNGYIYIYISGAGITQSGSLGVFYQSNLGKRNSLMNITNGVGYDHEGFLAFKMKENVYMGKHVYVSEDSKFVYKKGYFKSKNVGHDRKSRGDESGITYIFNDDWGVTTWCYACFGGGFD